MKQEVLEKFMWEAIVEGRKAKPKCFPNPPVGCVIVKDGIIVSRGHTGAPGENHAEVMALENLESGITDFLMFVTLEPCSFQGRTPSCAKTIIHTPVKKVFVGIIDPHPKNNGAGIDILSSNGVEVEIGLLAQEIEKELVPYLISE